MKDFFARYKDSRKHHVIVPGIFGILFAFSIVASYQDTPINFGSLQANILNAGTSNMPIYGADLVINKRMDRYEVIFGENANDVGNIQFSILGDPSLLKEITSPDPEVVIQSQEPGVFRIQKNINKDLKAGDVLFSFQSTVSGETPLAIVDALFISSGSTFSLSTKVDQDK